MLGATTYITTDIAPIPLLWVVPLGLYLLTFIIVFAKISELAQSAVVFAEAVVVLSIGMTRVHPLVENASPWVNGIFWAVALALFAGAGCILFLRDRDLNHKAMILALPLLVLLVIFMMLSEIKPGITDIIALHLLTLFVVAMVCHGELARDRPPASHLTEFFLLMSVGGVVGGLFNAMFAPLAFNSLAEYPIAMVAACLLLPPLTQEKPTRTSRYIDLTLAGVYVVSGVALIALRLCRPLYRWDLSGTPLENSSNWSWLLVGLLLGMIGAGYLVLRGWTQQERLSSGVGRCSGLLTIGGPLLLVLAGFIALVCQFGQVLDWPRLTMAPMSHLGRWALLLLGPILALAGGALLVWRNWNRSEDLWGRLLDLAMPLALLVLVVGLVLGSYTIPVKERLIWVTERDPEEGRRWLPFTADRLQLILMYGLPAILCYTCVERSIRFGLCVGAILLGSSFCNIFNKDEILRQTRSFFGVLIVETQGEHFKRLLHGTTLHGQQFAVEDQKELRGLVLGMLEKELKGDRPPRPEEAARLTHLKEQLEASRRWQELSQVLLCLPDTAGRFLPLSQGLSQCLHDAAESNWRTAYLEFLGPLDADESPRRLPLTYYHRTGPIGQIMEAYSTEKSKPPVALIGLGTGTMATYCRPGQKFTFYDIDPLVVEISTRKDRRLMEEYEKVRQLNEVRAERGEKPFRLPQEYHFTFWKDALERGANLNLIINDARLAIEKQVAENEKVEADNRKLREEGKEPMPLPHEKYKIMVIDAFSSDAIPIHLITRQALQLYLKILDEDGIIAFHISNRYLDLRPVLHNLADKENLAVYSNSDDKEHYAGKTSSTWVALARDRKYMDRLINEEKMTAVKDQWKDTARVLMCLPDTGGRLLPFSQGLNYALTANQAPWKVPGSIEGDVYLLPTNAAEDIASIVARRRHEQEPLALRIDSRPSPADYPTEERYKKKLREYEALYHKKLKEYEQQRKKVGVWTDDYSNVLSVFSWK